MADFPETLVGTELVYTLPLSGGAPKEGDIDEREGEDFLLTFTTPEEVGHGVKVKDQQLKARFLDYLPHKITICEIKNEGILSGPFSGCWFMRFLKDGVLYAAHIGTNGVAIGF